MAYPYLPDNTLIVDGVDISAKFKMFLTDGYELEPPSPKTYVVDIPGGNGSIDLTESLIGDTVYENRSQEFTFYLIDVDNFEKVKTDISNFLHGKAYDYRMTMDPDYTYHGRFSVKSYTHDMYAIGKVGVIVISIDADPYKYLDDKIYKIDAVGGKIVYFESGRKRVRPTIETDGFLKVIYDGELLNLPQGTWTINDLLFTYGPNEVYFNSYDIHNITWGQLKENSVTWGDFKKKRLFEWYKSNGDGTMVVKTWNDVEDKTWTDLAETTWADLSYMTEVTKDIKEIYVTHEVGDL